MESLLQMHQCALVMEAAHNQIIANVLQTTKDHIVMSLHASESRVPIALCAPDVDPVPSITHVPVQPHTQEASVTSIPATEFHHLTLLCAAAMVHVPLLTTASVLPTMLVQFVM